MVASAPRGATRGRDGLGFVDVGSADIRSSTSQGPRIHLVGEIKFQSHRSYQEKGMGDGSSDLDTVMGSLSYGQVPSKELQRFSPYDI